MSAEDRGFQMIVGGDRTLQSMSSGSLSVGFVAVGAFLAGSLVALERPDFFYTRHEEARTISGALAFVGLFVGLPMALSRATRS
jgi:hypothetical protein